MDDMILTLIIFLPLLAAIVSLFIKHDRSDLIRATGLVTSIATFVLCIYVALGFSEGQKDYQFEVNLPWIPQWGINYHVGIDGISLLLILLTAFLCPLVILASWTEVREKVKAYIVCLLTLETGMLGTFASLDLILFYVFWEMMLVPMYLLIGVWGGPRRIYAAVKFFLYTMAGSVLMLVAILVVYFSYTYSAGGKESHTFDLVTLTARHTLTGRAALLCFLAFGVAFAIKVPMFPFHTWLPDAHVEAPTAGSVILAGVLLKMGTYGFLRFCLPLFPQIAVAVAPVICILAIVGILYGALVAMAQTDIKKLVAYSSVSHLGYVMLGMFAFNMYGLSGSLIQMINHGLSTGALFLIVGMIYERRHTRLIRDFGGLARTIPLFTVFFLFATLSSVGLPGLNGFVGEYLILLGTFQINAGYAIFGTFGIVLSAAYLLRAFRDIMHGPLEKPENASLKDLNRREVAVLVPIVACMLWIGLYPKWFFASMDASVQRVEEVICKAQDGEDALHPARIWGHGRRHGMPLYPPGAGNPTPVLPYPFQGQSVLHSPAACGGRP